MQIKEITDKSQWETFIINQKPNTFLQSWNWGKFNSAMGDLSTALGASKIFRLGIFSGQDLVGTALVIKVNARRGKFLFCPHGPVIMNHESRIKNQELWKIFFDYLKDLAKKENVDFIRISPLLKNAPENLETFKKAGFRNAPIHMMHPEISWILDISKSKEEIFKGMRKTHRNLIRRAERDGVETVEGKNIENVDEFYKLHKQTVSRHGFVPFSKDYLKKELEALAPENQISIFFAKHGGQILSSAIIIFYGDSAFYHHGASFASKIPASHFLLWKIIQESKKRGCRLFNFWGIAPEGKPKHPWAGLSLFKKGFGGYPESYLHAQDLPVKNSYFINWLIESLRRWRRGY